MSWFRRLLGGRSDGESTAPDRPSTRPPIGDRPWAQLEGPYGVAPEVPRWLDELSAADAATRSAALESLWAHLVHQGSVYPLTVRAIPRLIDQLAETTADRPGLLELLSFCALGDPWDCLPFGAEMASFHRLDEALEIERQAYEAVECGVPRFVELLASDRETRLWAIQLLAWFPGRNSESVAPLRRLLASTDEEAELTALLWTLGLLGQGSAPEVVAKRADSRPAVAATAAMASMLAARGAGVAPQAADVVAILNFLAANEGGSAKVPFDEGRLAIHLPAVILSAAVDHGNAVIRPIAGFLEDVESERFESLVEVTSLLLKIFDQARAEQRLADAAARAILRAIADQAGWDQQRWTGESCADLLRQRKLPESPDALRAWLDATSGDLVEALAIDQSPDQAR